MNVKGDYRDDYKLDIEKLDGMGIRCGQCEHYENGVCYGYEKQKDREGDSKICDRFEPDMYIEYY